MRQVWVVTRRMLMSVQATSSTPHLSFLAKQNVLLMSFIPAIAIRCIHDQRYGKFGRS